MQTCASFHNPPNLVLSVYLQTPPRPYGVDLCARHMWRLDVAREVATTNGVWSSTIWKADSVLKLVRSPAPLDCLSTCPWAKSWTLSWPWCIHPSTTSSNSWVMIQLWKVWDKWEMEKFCLPVCVGFTSTMESGWSVCSPSLPFKLQKQQYASNQSNHKEVFANQLGNTRFFPQQQVVVRGSLTGQQSCVTGVWSVFGLIYLTIYSHHDYHTTKIADKLKSCGHVSAKHQQPLINKSR